MQIKLKELCFYVRWTNIPEQNFNPQYWSKSSTTTIRPFPVFRSAESFFSSNNTLGFLKISWYSPKHILKAPFI
jgi:hypothetical protein